MAGPPRRSISCAPLPRRAAADRSSCSSGTPTARTVTSPRPWRPIARSMTAEVDAPIPAAVAWRLGQIHQQQGEPRRALEVYGRADLTDADAVDHAWLLTNVATAYWLLGDADQALAHARAAGARATIAADPQVRAAAHVAMALSVSLSGDPATVEEEYARAAGCAADAGDLVQLAQINAKRSHHLLADARFAEAVDVAAAAGAAAEQFGSRSGALRRARQRGRGVAPTRSRRRSRPALRTGAGAGRADRNAANRLCPGRPGPDPSPPRVARAGPGGSGAGAAAAGRGAGPAGHGSPPWRVWPSRSSRRTWRTPRSWPSRPCGRPTGSSRLPALLAAGRTAWARGDVGAARCLAGQAVEHARQRRERAWLAEALELRATTVDQAPARAALREAYQIWHDAGAGHDADRILVQLARRAPTSAPDRLAARGALTRLAAAGVLASTDTGEGSTTGRVRIVTFGRFEVIVDGVAVPAETWQSRRARELLRLLVCRRGRAIPRLEICETLWPDDDPDRTMHRLSVLLSIVRGVLGSDALIADQACVALDRARVQVDVEQFLADVGDAVALARAGRRAGRGCTACRRPSSATPTSRSPIAVRRCDDGVAG